MSIVLYVCVHGCVRYMHRVSCVCTMGICTVLRTSKSRGHQVTYKCGVAVQYCVGLPVKVYPTFISFDDRNLSCYAGHRPSNKIHDLSYGKQNVPKIFNRDHMQIWFACTKNCTLSLFIVGE